MSPPPGRRPVDLVLLAFAGAEVLALVIATVAWQPTWRALMADFGSSPATFTRVVLGPAFALGGAAAVATLAVVGALSHRRPRLALALLIVALTVGVLVGAAIVLGSYAPVFQMGNAIRAE